MKNLIIALALLICISCEETSYTSTGSIVNMTVSHKEELRGRSIIWIMYFQTPTETIRLSVSLDTYNSYNVGDKMTGLIITNTTKCPEE